MPLTKSFEKIAYTSKKSVILSVYIYICICQVLPIGKQCSGSFCYIYITSCYYNSKFRKNSPETNKEEISWPPQTKQKILPPYYLLCKVPGKISLPLIK